MPHYGLRRELATLRTQLAALGERALPSYEAAAQAHAERVARRGWQLMDALLDDGLPRRYAAVVATEARDEPSAWSPLTWRAWDICRWSSAAEHGANVCPYPLRVTEADCALLLTEAPGAVEWVQTPVCQDRACGYVVPCRAGYAGSVAAPWVWTPDGVPCSACGGWARWPWQAVWWRGEDADCWQWTAADGRVRAMDAPYPRRETR